MTIYYTRNGQRQPVKLARDDQGQIIITKRRRVQIILPDDKRKYIDAAKLEVE